MPSKSFLSIVLHQRKKKSNQTLFNGLKWIRKLLRIKVGTVQMNLNLTLLKKIKHLKNLKSLLCRWAKLMSQMWTDYFNKTTKEKWRIQMMKSCKIQVTLDKRNMGWKMKLLEIKEKKEETVRMRNLSKNKKNLNKNHRVLETNEHSGGTNQLNLQLF